MLTNWLNNVSQFSPGVTSTVAYYQPWVGLAETKVDQFSTVVSVMPATLRVTAFSGDINLVGNITLAPSSTGTIDLAAAGSLNGLQPTGFTNALGVSSVTTWGYSRINLSDANPRSIPNIDTPFAYQSLVGNKLAPLSTSDALDLSSITNLFAETGSTQGAAGVLQTKQALHGPGPLHASDSDPVHLYAAAGDISGVTLFSGKAARVVASGDIADIGFYIQNDNASDITVVSSGRDIIASDLNSLLRTKAQLSGNTFNVGTSALSGDIQINGPGTLEVLAGRHLDLGVGRQNTDGTGAGITSIGNARNPYLPFAGADIIAAAGVGVSLGLDTSNLDFKNFITQFIDKPVVGARYLSELSDMTTASGITSPQDLDNLAPEHRDILALDLFYLVLRDAGRDHNKPTATGPRDYSDGFAAATALFGSTQQTGDISTQTRDIRTKSGGNISILAPRGKLTLQTSVIGSVLVPPGVITEDGGNISIMTEGSVKIGISRIFTLRGGNIVIWSSKGDIAAGSSSKTVQSAPPTRVLVDPQSGDVKTDLSGLATGGGIGVLATVDGVPPGNVDLIAPVGTIDAGDAGIRVTGNINIAAAVVLNASNIQAAGSSAGVPTTTVSAPNLSGLASASATAGAGTQTASETAKQARSQQTQQEESPSIISVEVISYGGDGEGSAANTPAADQETFVTRL